jgi:cytochrome c peroxidase
VTARAGVERGRGLLASALLLLFSPSFAADAPVAGADAAAYPWNLPKGFPVPVVPPDNPMSEEKVALGRRLFYEKALSASGTHACATCHRQRSAFTDGRARAVGINGDLHPHSAMALVNVAYNPAYMWAEPAVRTLESQVVRPLYNEQPVEMGLKGRESAVMAALGAQKTYTDGFARAFPQDPRSLRIENVFKAIAAFERTLISARSGFDRYVFEDDRTAMSETARRGMALFYSERIGCARCHFGINFSGPIAHADSPSVMPLYANTALFNVDGRGGSPADQQGLANVTHRSRDQGRFRVPTLRNIAVTAPYMHDGSLATLDEVLDHYAAGGRQAPLGPATRNRHRDERLRPFTLTFDERKALLAFLDSLTDQTFLTDPRFGPPESP